MLLPPSLNSCYQEGLYSLAALNTDRSRVMSFTSFVGGVELYADTYLARGVSARSASMARCIPDLKAMLICVRKADSNTTKKRYSKMTG